MTQLIWFDTTQQFLSHRFRHFTFLSSVRDLGSLLIVLLPSQIVSPTSLVPPIFIWDVLGLSDSLPPRLSTSSAHAFVCSRINYCNSLLVGLPIVELSPTQTVLIATDRFNARLPRLSHISPFMTKQLHWLPPPALNSKLPALNSKFLSSFLSLNAVQFLNIFAITSDTLYLLPPYTVAALPNAIIFSCLVFG